MLNLLSSPVVAVVLSGLVFAWFGRFVVTGYRVRAQLHKLPGPPHSWLWGHLKIMGEVTAEVPPRAHPHVLGLRIQKKYNIKANYFYLDVWPLAEPICYVFDPEIAQQVTVDHAIPKHPRLADFLIHLAGPGDLVSSDGPHWKKWRSIMNPGFAASHLMSLVAGIVDDSVVFCEKLGEHAETGRVFRLEEEATRLTVDIVGKVTLDVKLNTQRGNNTMVDAFREQVQLLPNEGMSNPLAMYHPYGIYRRWSNNRTMVKYIGQVLDERFAKGGKSAVVPSKAQRVQRKRAILDLALDAYQAQLSGVEAEKGQVSQGTPAMDAEFRQAAITQIRTFIFAGHDTTSSTIAWTLYELQRNPECLERIRQEHDAVLGPAEGAADVIKKDPHILNKLEYTLATVRETLRLWPAASATRAGEPGFMIRDPQTGDAHPTEGFLVWVVHYCLHRSPKVWGETANKFDPSRFLPENESKLPANGWRPFEKGPRNCIGQELALIEARVILALVCRSYDFTPAFDSLKELKDDGSYYSKNEKWRQGKQDLDGEEAYGVLIGTAKPREGMPMRVSRVTA